MVVVGAAVLGKENNPLYVRAFGQYDQLRFQFIVHTALDSVEEKGVPRSCVQTCAHCSNKIDHRIWGCPLIVRAVAAQRQAAQGGSGGNSKFDSYLGLLYPIEEYRVYGFLSNCRVKLIVVLDEEEVKDGEMKALFRRLHALYVDTVSNPFHTPDSELYGCASFDRQVERIVEAGLY